jgi:hypothetical protein
VLTIELYLLSDWGKIEILCTKKSPIGLGIYQDWDRSLNYFIFVGLDSTGGINANLH